MRPEILAPLALRLGEGARDIGGALHLVDLVAGVLYRRTDGELTPIVRSDRPIGAAAAVAGDPGRLVLAEGLGVALVDPSAPEPTVERMLALEPDDRLATHRVNDAAVDPAGALWVGTMPYGDGRTGSVYRVGPGFVAERVLAEIACPNGPAFAADGTVYLADTVARVILRSSLRDDGTIAAFTPFATVEGGLPDGMLVDEAGDLWVAIWGAGEVRRYAPDGRLAQTVALGARQPTSVCLLDLDGVPSLVVTSARVGLADPAQGDGAVWVAECDARPVPPTPFRA